MNVIPTVVLAGNPNSGKTALFNAITGLHHRVGNWPGVTVDKMMGRLSHRGEWVNVIDLPGTYSLSGGLENGAIDESIACDYLRSGEASLIINIIDASNLERNLYLTLQLLEMKIPMILAVNMMDIVKQRGISINLEKLSQLTGCPAVGLVASQRKGIEALKELILKIQKTPRVSDFALPLPEAIEEARKQIALIVQETEKHNVDQNWLALRVLEGDSFVASYFNEALSTHVSNAIRSIELAHHEEPDVLIADARYRAVNQITMSVIEYPKKKKQAMTQWVDAVVLNRILGIPIFFAVMYFMFFFAINIGGAFQDFFDMGSSTIFVTGFAHLLARWHFPPTLIVLLANGVGKGINTTITFTPVIAAMFLFLAFLEDSGYMARAAFVMDRAMRALGLPGKSFVPMIVGFGCNVPAVMGARALENRRDRILTVMMMPFMSCGARLAIFAVFASAFFPEGGASLIFMLYLLGILVAVLTGFVLRKTVLTGKPAPLVMELPPYHVPRVGQLFRHMWLRLSGFLFRAGRFIVPICMLVGVLNSVNITGKMLSENNPHSILSSVGRVATPIFLPMGLHQANWPATVGLATGILAKEVVVGTLNTLYSSPETVETTSSAPFNFWGGLRAAIISIPANFSQLGNALINPISASEAPHAMNKTAYREMYHAFDGKIGAFAYLLFVLLYFPCVSTMAAMSREVGRRWALFSVLWSTGLAYALAVMAYQALSFVLHPWSSFAWVMGAMLVMVVAIFTLKHFADRGHSTSGLISVDHLAEANDVGRH